MSVHSCGMHVTLCICTCLPVLVSFAATFFLPVLARYMQIVALRLYEHMCQKLHDHVPSLKCDAEVVYDGTSLCPCCCGCTYMGHIWEFLCVSMILVGAADCGQPPIDQQ